MKKLGFSFPLVHYGKDELIDVSEAWSVDEKRNVQVTSTVGYVPLEKRVSAMINAGIVLEGMKDEFYGVESSEPEDGDDDLVQDFDSKIELMRSCKERSERLVDSFKRKEQTNVKSKERTSIQPKEVSVENVSEDSSEDNIATEDSSGVNASKDQ